MRPLIAVAGGIESRPPRGDAVWAWARYMSALDAAGCTGAVVMPSPAGTAAARDVLQRFDGLLIPGGPDVDPTMYGQERHPETYGVDRRRDDFEAALLQAAIEISRPVLAICRGMQILNVALGGTLDQHIVDRTADAHGRPGGHGALHGVHLEPGSQVAGAMGTLTPVACSCHHHQSVARLAPGLRAVGRSPDGILEAVEHERAPVMAVQWHPEDTALEDPEQMGLFLALARRSVRQ